MKKKLLEVQGLHKYFPIRAGLFRKVVGYVHAVRDVSFTIFSGEVLGIVGESGCGKSTLARTAIRLIEPTKGSISLMGKDLLSLSEKELLTVRKNVQMVFQDPSASLNPRKTVSESVGESLTYHRVEGVREEIVAQALKNVGLSTDALFRYPHEFSGGQQQRICIARALVMNPKLVVCDEAVSALDVSVQAQVLNLLGDLRQQYDFSYLFISHDLSVVRHISDRVVVMYLGKVMEEATTEELFANPKHPYTQFLLEAIPPDDPRADHKRKILKGDIPSAINPPSGCPFRTRCPYAKPECAEPPPKKEIGDSHTYYCILD